jgi:hypothetical protein
VVLAACTTTGKALNNQPARDFTKACYADGQPFSLGAVHNGQTCSRPDVLTPQNPQPLEWK